jgi:Toprim-like/Protein of unknown function (DUF3991)
MFESELENYKTNIDLRAYAASLGYQRDAKESWKGSDVMRHPNGDKILVTFGTKRARNHWGYYSFRSDDDHGSIIDFVERRKGLRLRKVRSDWAKLGNELRPWIGKHSVPVPAFASPDKNYKDRTSCSEIYARMEMATRHPYLERERALPSTLFEHERFAGRLRIDKRGNTVFPHFDQYGLCGYEIKNHGFTGFASGGTKGLWLSHERSNDNRLIFCESAIDALSYAVLFPDDHARYASIGGKLNPVQPELMRSAAARMQQNSEIVAAMDADAEGGKLAGVVRKAVDLTGRLDLRYSMQEPFGFKDWNDQLRARPNPLLSYRPEVPSVV